MLGARYHHLCCGSLLPAESQGDNWHVIVDFLDLKHHPRNNRQKLESRFDYTRRASAAMASPSDDEDDYMKMVIAEPVEAIKETSIQRAARKKKEVGISYVSRSALGADANGR